MRQPDRIIRLKTVLTRTGLSRSTIYPRWQRAHSPLSSRSAPTARAGMNPTSTAGLPTLPDGVRAASLISSMTTNRSDKGGSRRPANDNHPSDGQDAGQAADASARVDAVVLTIARLIGRQIAREHFEALQAANDNNEPSGEK